MTSTPPPERGSGGLGRLADLTSSDGDGRPPGLLDSVGGRDMLLDSGLPSLVFVVVFTIAGPSLTPAIVAALAAGVVLAGIRVATKGSLQHSVAGLIGLGISVAVAARTGRAEDVYLPRILTNLAYLVAYVVSIAVRWPLLGVFVGLIRGGDMSWRRDPVLLRAFTQASWIWVAMFALRLAVQVPIYLAGTDQIVALGVVSLAMGWPLFFCCVYLSYVIIARALRRSRAATSGARAD